MVSTDVVVVLPGIMGSTLGLREGDRPASEKMIWALDAGAIWRGATGLGPSIKDFALPAGIGDGHPGDGIEPVGLMGDVHVIPGLWTPIRGYDTLPAHLRKLGYDEGKGNLVLLRLRLAAVQPVQRRSAGQHRRAGAANAGAHRAVSMPAPSSSSSPTPWVGWCRGGSSRSAAEPRSPAS